KFLQEKLQLEVRKLQKLQRLAGESVLTAPQYNENVLSFAVAYGLALQGLKLPRLQTNLLPREIQFERLVRAKKPWAAAAVAALLLGVAGLTLGRTMEHRAISNPEVKKALAEGKKSLDRAKGFQADYQKEEEAYKTAEATIDAIGSGLKERFNWR